MNLLLAFLALVVGCSSLSLSSLRKMAAGVGIGSSLALSPPPAFAETNAVKPDFNKEQIAKEVGPVEIKGTITLEEGAIVPESPSRALYVTAKPDLGFINSQLLLRKFPAVMSKRIPGENVQFPLEFTISEKMDGTEEVSLQRERWVNLPLIMSVRYDSDGVAATREPTDLVGKGESIRDSASNSWSVSNVALSDRDIGGKLVTGGK